MNPRCVILMAIFSPGVAMMRQTQWYYFWDLEMYFSTAKLCKANPWLTLRNWPRIVWWWSIAGCSLQCLATRRARVELLRLNYITLWQFSSLAYCRPYKGVQKIMLKFINRPLSHPRPDMRFRILFRQNCVQERATAKCVPRIVHNWPEIIFFP